MSDKVEVETAEKVRLVYTGIELYRPNRNTIKKFYAYVEIGRMDEYVRFGNGSRVFNRKLVDCSVGGIIEVPASYQGERLHIEGTPVFVEMWGTLTQRMDLQAVSAANVARYEGEMRAKKMATAGELDEVLIPLKRAFGKMNGRQRRSFIAWLLDYLEN